MTTPSLAYRKHQPEIWNGFAPVKYTRLLPFITGRRILELGAAEGVLSLLVADRNPEASVTALELREARHQEALALQTRWRAIGRHVDGCTMVCGDLRERLDLLEEIDTLVAVRSIYYLREDIDTVFKEIAQHAHRVVLCGNANREQRYADTHGAPGDNLGPFNFYASVDGMCAVLDRAGYRVGPIVREGDPIVIGHR